jgi:hypothetical protein
MPEMTGIRTRTTEYRPHAARNFTTPLSAVESAVEIIVSFKAPVPARAVSPVLYVGETRLTESESVDKKGKELRFWSFEPSRLQEGAPIEVRWMGEPPSVRAKAEKVPKFRYSSPKR